MLRLIVGRRIRVAVADQRLLVRWASTPPAELRGPAALAGRWDPAQRGAWSVERLAARALLRMLLVEELGPAAGDTPLAAYPTGQPYLPDWPRIGVSLSHDAGTVAAALGLGVPVGVDVQTPVPAPPALLRRCCAPPVQAALDRLPAAVRDREFAWIWSVQEACVKATGAGLAGAPWTVPVPYRRRAGRWRDLRWRSLRGRSRVPVSVAWRLRGGAR
ncbi:4-phosphopantetheinyl transferase [Micromonospora deserti]|uniref:4-phosphopantetheinyl transferase n=2 Tax=Micromonospora deserti TaxID=2070366 RepID=A0A2W2DBF5_9ACTN|nr:4-phosphopantetheinyl transferase [Micromonospora deserti]